MAYQFSRKGCFKTSFTQQKKVGHLAEGCTASERLCYNCRQPGHESSSCPSPRSVSAKQCYSCGGVGHIVPECPSLRIQQQGGGGQKCYNCGRFGHIARACPSGALGGAGAFVPRPAPPGRGLNTSTLPTVKVMCYRCGGPNHMARFRLGPPWVTRQFPTGPAALKKAITCYKCQMEGHIARECPENADFMG
ncbi:hypothetical protein FB45DRAFT_976853 [Roridomyces roridus]|uniref:CCHC-type domain-containing protein n=1 Tax=Roridomyces roridus TaxID=1738132 RepID=A0AAD7C4H6_9AGAR|nr:hypothetical protein FB45DRAFT_976853 [Roridomyces roridus]